MDKKQTNVGWKKALASYPTHLYVNHSMNIDKDKNSLGLACKGRDLQFQIHLRLPKGLAGVNIWTHSQPSGFNTQDQDPD